VDELGVDFFTLSAHKVYGPKGIGAIYRAHRAGRRLRAQIHGGGQEGGIRSGTVNVPGVAGLAAALDIARSELDEETQRVATLRDLLERRLTSSLDGCTINGAVDGRLPGTSNLSFDGVNGNALLASLPDVAISSGSACTAAHGEPSHVLRAMGMTPRRAAASLRFSLGRFTTEADVSRAAERVIEEVTRLRGG
jgi:cysteine desulfurase